MGETGGFCRNSVANTAKPATLGKVFASGKPVFRRHAFSWPVIDEHTKAVHWPWPGKKSQRARSSPSTAPGLPAAAMAGKSPRKPRDKNPRRARAQPEKHRSDY